MTENGLISLLATLIAGVFVALMENLDMRSRGFWSNPERWFIGFLTYAAASIVIADVYWANVSRPEWLDKALVTTAVGAWVAAMVALMRMTTSRSR